MGILDLWLPILISTAVSWAMSAVIWVALKYHNTDYKKLKDEDAASAGLRGHAPGYYLLPHCLDPADMQDPNVKQKFADGPIAYITMLPNSVPAMGPRMISMIL
jgi:hypothetical protein